MSQDKQIKTMTLDLAKVLSYLTELQKTNNQVYVTPEGVAFLEGVVVSGSPKVKVVSYYDYLILKTKTRTRPKKSWFNKLF